MNIVKETNQSSKVNRVAPILPFYHRCDLDFAPDEITIDKFEEYADYRKLLDEIHHIRAKELQKRDAELSSLEAEEKTISEAEALLDKQTKKEGQSIGE